MNLTAVTTPTVYLARLPFASLIHSLNSFSDNLKEHISFLKIQSTGEQTNNMWFTQISEYYTRELTSIIKTLTLFTFPFSTVTYYGRNSVKEGLVSFFDGQM
jgi:hypothetical protein